MVTFPAGDVVLVPFPFSDLSDAKLRPAVVLAKVNRGDWILCQVTSNAYGDRSIVILDERSFTEGALRRTSYARPGKIFTANHSLIVRNAGSLHSEIFTKIIHTLVKMLQEGSQ